MHDWSMRRCVKACDANGHQGGSSTTQRIIANSIRSTTQCITDAVGNDAPRRAADREKNKIISYVRVYNEQKPWKRNFLQ